MRVIAVHSDHDKLADILSLLEGFEANEFND